AGQIRAGRQPQDRQGDRAYVTARDSCPRRRGDRMMRRRQFISLLGGAAAAWPLAARAQQIKSVRRLGVLMPEAENDAQSQAQVRALEHGLTQLGWSPGKNLQIDYRWAAGDLHGTRLAAAELVRLAPDVLLAAATPPVRALQQATNTIPIVFAGITEP